MRMSNRLPGSLVVLALALSAQANPLLAGDPAAPGQRRFKVLFDVVAAPGSLTFTQNKAFREYNEPASLTVQHEAKTGLGGGLGLEYDFSPHFGAILTLGFVSRNASGTYEASLPHPLYFDKKRSVTGEVSGTSYRELTGSLDVAYLGQAGGLSFSVFAGPTVFSTSTDLANSLQYSQTYPFDTVTVNSIPTSSEGKTAFGFNVGAGVDYSLGETWSVGGQVRYSRTKITLEPEADNKAELDAGGLYVSLGVRLHF